MTSYKKTNNTSSKGLASASPETKLRVASAGGKAEHSLRGLQSANQETRQRVASAGGQASSRKKDILKHKKDKKRI